jgi:hypothetical protein
VNVPAMSPAMSGAFPSASAETQNSLRLDQLLVDTHCVASEPDLGLDPLSVCLTRGHGRWLLHSNRPGSIRRRSHLERRTLRSGWPEWTSSRRLRLRAGGRGGGFCGRALRRAGGQVEEFDQ